MLLVFIGPDGREAETCFRYGFHMPTAVEVVEAGETLAIGHAAEVALVLMGADHDAVHAYFDALWTPGTPAARDTSRDLTRHLHIVRNPLRPEGR